MFDSYTQALTGTPVRIVKLPYGIPKTMVYITNESTTGDIFLGDNVVSENNGYLITKQTGTGVAFRAEFEMFAGQEIWACTRVGGSGIVHIGYSA